MLEVGYPPYAIYEAQSIAVLRTIVSSDTADTDKNKRFTISLRKEKGVTEASGAPL